MLKKYKISDIGTVITGITPSTQNKLNYSNNDYKFICIPDFKANNRYLKNSNNYISKYAFDKIANKHLHKDDIAISCIGTIGNVGIIWDDCISNQQINSITSINKKFVPMYIYYNLSTKYLLLKKISGNGTALDIIPKSIFEKIEIDIHSIDEQQHIVNTIGTVDDLIEKYQEIIEKLNQFGDLHFAKNQQSKTINLINICSLNTGKEIGAMNYLEHYLEGTIPFIRVSTLKDNIYDIYCEPKNVALCKINDILISFDGTPGRIGYGLSGAYSSGMKKVECDPKNKGLIYFYFRTEKCQNKILEHKKGSVIPHFSTSIPELKIPLFDVQVTIILNNLFNILVMLRQKINILQVVKQVLLDKYFK